MSFIKRLHRKLKMLEGTIHKDEQDEQYKKNNIKLQKLKIKNERDRFRNKQKTDTSPNSNDRLSSALSKLLEQ